MPRLVVVLLLLALVTPTTGQTLERRSDLPVGYFGWTLTRADGSTLTFFSNFARLQREKPLAIWMQGSGYHSLFPVRDGTARLGPMSLISEALGPSVQILAVEKRGVAFGTVGGGGAVGAPLEYHEHATLEERAGDVIIMLTAFQIHDGLPDLVLAVGHSEGADVAAKVAADFAPVTHLAFLSGGGASQLFDFMALIRKSPGTAEEKETEIEALWKSWKEIQEDPLSSEKMFQGHAYRRWSSYIRQAPVDNLLKTHARILMIHGSADQAVPIESADLCAVELSRHDREFEYLRLPGADHSLRTAHQVEAYAPPFLPLGYVLRRFFLGGDGAP